jgi:hypothetical protein
MAALPSFHYTLRIRSDDFSDQISCDEDKNFWFRIENAGDCDTITDFFLGGFDPALAGDLLVECYRKLNRKPRVRIVFGNILSSRPSDAAAIRTASERFEDAARQLLASHGRALRSAHIERRPRDKVDLVIE